MLKPLLLLLILCVQHVVFSQEDPKIVLAPSSGNAIQSPGSITITTETQSNPAPVIVEEASYPTNGGYTISKKAGEEQVLHDNAYYQSKIDIINQTIQAIDLKVNHVWNSTEKEEAEANGWFEQMYETKQALIQERDEYQALIN